MTTNQNQLSGTDAYRRIMQHELGHFHALKHKGSAVRSTVMRTPHGQHGQYLPNNVTSCDAWKALEAGSQ